MDNLKDKLLKLKEELNKSMKQGGIGGPGAVKRLGAVLPSLKAVTTAGKATGNKSATPSTGITQQSKKNPIKSAEQTQNKDIKDIKMKEAQAAMKGPSMTKKEGRCWDGYEPTPGKKAYEDGSCKPIKKKEHIKVDAEIAPEGSKNRESYKDEFEKKEYIQLNKGGQWSLEKMKHRETAVPGVSELGIEARRATGKPTRETGYARVSTPEHHKNVAKQIAKENLKETKKIKPKLVKNADEYGSSSDKVVNNTTVNEAKNQGTDVNIGQKASVEVNKSGYKGYTETDNIRRKKNNMSEDTGIHSMNRIKRYGGSGPDAAGKEAKKYQQKNKKQPVKTFSTEEIAAINKERGLKKK